MQSHNTQSKKTADEEADETIENSYNIIGEAHHLIINE